MAMHADNLSFSRRLAALLDGRSLAAWALRLGLGRAAFDALQAGRPPDARSLERIRRIEGVRRRWLLNGQGPAFTVVHAADEDATALALQTMLHERPGWARYPLRAGTTRAVVLTHPGHLDRPHCPYTIVAVFGGPVGAGVTDLLARYGALHEQQVDAATMERLRGGRIGPFALLGDAGRPGLLESPPLAGDQAGPLDLDRFQPIPP